MCTQRWIHMITKKTAEQYFLSRAFCNTSTFSSRSEPFLLFPNVYSAHLVYRSPQTGQHSQDSNIHLAAVGLPCDHVSPRKEHRSWAFQTDTTVLQDFEQGVTWLLEWRAVILPWWQQLWIQAVNFLGQHADGREGKQRKMDSCALTGKQVEMAYLGGEVLCRKMQLGMEDGKGE